MYAISLTSKYMDNRTRENLQTTKQILRHLSSTTHLRIFYGRQRLYLVGFRYSDYAGYIDDGKSMSEYVFFSGNVVVSCSSKKQHIITWSSIEAEYVAAKLVHVKLFGSIITRNNGLPT